ncbi:iron dependent repressor, metal binding and dimerization domain protein [Methanonatronarchaeum sp. AMET-Sl]|uniref:metal-dependent transcriptional regulator n=1 Tax=Methanonatronarchaeum sp. AMET-Sl TaxID=3037654 RepID=UPI00244E595B|nr:iron dependent repressor, metal binding and dimerization domain protein [Methanonatronarchaeum sp. AMET-Sl]WGI17556.1 iron dependent repressor, metal binding and dimerization domain protein [Methanonatronarchaeum sp. AMET-Sl]
MVNVNYSKTERDIQYLRTIIKQNGHKKPVGPAKVAEERQISRAGAYKKMKHLSKHGYGEYIPGEGFLITEKGLKTIKNEIKKHHIVENFLRTHLNLTPKESCQESYRIAPFFSKNLIKKIEEKTDHNIKYKCKFHTEKKVTTKHIPECHWTKQKTLTK